MNSENPLEPQEATPATDKADQTGGFVEKILTACMIFVASVAMIFVKPAQYLSKQVYEKSSGRTFAWGAGLLVSMAAGIATGYPLFLAHSAITTWVPLAVAMVMLTYFYAWPVVYLLLFSWAFRASRVLWRNVPDFRESGRGKQVWLSRTLGVLTIAAAVVASVYLAYSVGTAIFTWLAWTSFIGKLIAGAGSIVVGIGAGCLAGFLVISLTVEAGMPMLAIAAGGTSAYLLTARLAGLIKAHELPAWSNHIAQALIAFVVAAYLFPLAHLVISRCFGRLGRFFREAYINFIESVYQDKDANYVGFVRQAANFAVAYGVGTYAFAWAADYGLIADIAMTSVAVLLSYLIIGSVLAELTNVVVGITCAVLAAAAVYLYPSLHLYSGAWYVVGAQMLVAAVLTLMVAFPVAYRLVKLFANPLLASWLARPLIDLHQSIRREILSAHSNTYSDGTGFETLFSHMVNVAFTVFVYFASTLLVSTLVITGWMALALPALAVVSSYLLVGKLFLRFGNHLIGGLTGLAFGAFAGVQAFAHFNESYAIAIAFFASAVVLMTLVIYPVAYVLLRALINAASGMNWLLPLLKTVYDFFFGFVASFWSQFMVAYRRIEASFKPVWRRVSANWDKSWANAMATIDRVWNKSK